VQQLKMIPKVDKVLEWQAVRELLASHPRGILLKAVRATLDRLRAAALARRLDEAAFSEANICAEIVRELACLGMPSLKRVINGSGIVIHTNLGRSILPEAARSALNTIAFSYSNLEFDLEAGVRGSRYSHVESLICELTGAEAAIVVNNNAAAVLLSLSALAAGREAVVSRGELVEIGGSFRIPDVMRLSGVTLREVGTTNRTHAKDYSSAVSAETALFLKVHCSNFAVVGFTAEVSAAELVALGAAAGVPVLADMGSGNLVDLSGRLACAEPTVQEFVRAGVDVITFSGDKLLGGPQAGLIVGKKSFIEPMKKHPLLRALRMDKLTLATLEATLGLYRDERVAFSEVPTLRMLTASYAELAARAKLIARQLRRKAPETVSLTLSEGFSQAGGGTLPLLNLPTLLIEVSVAGMSPNEIESRLRNAEVPVIGRISKGAFLLDPRTILDEDLGDLAAALCSLAKPGSGTIELPLGEP
jgi:L-seryl-tRNA(Ser) seleniumtransferase